MKKISQPVQIGKSRAQINTINGISRRDFLKFTTLIAGAMALPASTHIKIQHALKTKKWPTFTWLQLSSCGGCSEAVFHFSSSLPYGLLNAIIPSDIPSPVFNTYLAREIEQSSSITNGNHILVVEGSLPKAENGVFCCIGGKNTLDILEENAKNSTAIIALGNCAVFGGIQGAGVNLSNSSGVMDILSGKQIINLPGCPINPLNFTATLVHYLTYDAFPSLDRFHRPLFTYATSIHDTCEKKNHYDAGEFVKEWGDKGHRLGWCLYEMGCRGIQTHNNCPGIKYNEGTNWPIGSGHGCIACSEPTFGDKSVYLPCLLPPSEESNG